MTHVSRREPRKYVDFSSVPPSQWKIHDRLTNWAKSCDSTPGQNVAPGFDLYRSSDARRAHGEETSIPVDKEDARIVGAGISRLDDKHRRAIHWAYLRPIRAGEKARELGTDMQGLADLVTGGRAKLIELLASKPIRFIPPGVPETAGQPGHNEHGVPLHATNGIRQDEHYWAWLKAKREGKA